MRSRLIAAILWATPLCAQTPPLSADTYNQWKEALRVPAATAAEGVTTRPGFTVELLRSAGPGDGSWIALAFDARGRAIISREDRGLLRLTLETERLEAIDDTLLEVRGLLFAHGVLYANANNSRALYRLRDADGDGHYEAVEKLRDTPGGVGHGRNQLALGPDGAIYSMHGDDVLAPEGGFDAASPFRAWREDKMRPAAWDRFLWGSHVRPPAGHLVRTDADGRRWEIVCGGLRNPFGLAFNADGEAFTYDADMEWDVGLPWYRPTRIVHLLSGADYGWRAGTRPLPAFFPDSTPAVTDLGKGSPTGCVFGTASRWPEPWRSALFAADWAYGRIHAVHLAAEGGTYVGRGEIFLEGRPLNVTSLTFGPDGELYFLTGGRRTQSGLYRVRWTGAGSSPQNVAAVDEARAIRRKLERFHGRADEQAIAAAWPALEHEWPVVRRAARTAIEAQPAEAWADRRLGPEAALALARVGGQAHQPRVQEALTAASLGRLAADEQLRWLRALEVSALRDDPAVVQAFVPALLALYPTMDGRVNRLLCELLAFAGAPEAVGRTAPLLAGPGAQEDQLHYLFTLAPLRAGWTLESRRAWLGAWRTARQRFIGGHTLGLNLIYARSAFVGTFSAEENEALAGEVAALDEAAAAPVIVEPRPLVQAWTMDSLTAAVAAVDSPPDVARGRRVFGAAGCAQCHRMGAAGQAVGPDLTDVGRRFDRRAVLESIVEPWRVIADPYRQVTLSRRSGEVVAGAIVAEDAERLTVANNPIDPDRRVVVPRADIAEQRVFSSMPPGLLNGFNAGEIRDLLSWLGAVR